MNARIVAPLGILGIAALPSAASAGLLDAIGATVHANTGNWLTNALNIADATFAALLTLYFVYTLCMAGARSMSGDRDMGSWVWDVGRAVMWVIIPAVLLKIVARDVLPHVVDDALILSGMITGGAALTPDAVFTVGLTKALQLVTATMTPLNNDLLAGGGLGGMFGLHSMSSLFTSLVLFLVALVVSLVVVVCFALLAVMLLVVTIEVYVSLAIGAINLGWLGSEGTAHMAQPYIGAVWSAVLRLITIYAWITLVTNLVNAWGIMAATADLHTFLFAAFELLAAAIAVLFMTFRLDRMADKIAGAAGAFGGVGEVAVGVASSGTRVAGRALAASRGGRT
jgi:hypothetical protein